MTTSTRSAGRCAVAIMAKAPAAGRSKTRLCPPLLHAEAALLSGAFLRDMTETVLHAAAAAPIDLFVAFAPAGTDAAVRDHVAAGATLVLADGEGIEVPGVTGFGRTLLQTMRELFARGYGAACVLNSDSPTLPSDVLVQAAGLLAQPGDRAVLGEAEDGGYYLLGLCAPHSALFANIAWSTGDVTAQTRLQAGRAGIDVIDLPRWYDVDDGESLRRLSNELSAPAAETCAPATAAMLDRLDVPARLNGWT